MSARTRGSVSGAAAFVLPGVAAVHVADGESRFLMLVAAACVAGVVSSLAARSYASGTSLLAGAGGLFGVWLLGRWPLASHPDALTVTGYALMGFALLLASYVAAWQADLRWTLGPGHPRKTVGRRELLLRNVPSLIVGAAVVLAVSRAAVLVVPAPAGWALACLAGGAVARALFHPHSTFFLWTAPLAALLAGGAAAGGIWPGAQGVPPGLLAPFGALAILRLPLGSLLPRGEELLWPARRLTRSAMSP